jgi:hypothetical protein
MGCSSCSSENAAAFLTAKAGQPGSLNHEKREAGQPGSLNREKREAGQPGSLNREEREEREAGQPERELTPALSLGGG